VKPLIFLLSGDLGCGKTVFSRQVGKILGVKEKITSPTFVIYNEYKTNNNIFLHFDLYRITADFELKEIDFFNLFKDNTISCIEWPENMGEKNLDELKKIADIKNINFKYLDSTTREIEYKI
jgi:tRNA threonylcarbamoyladenosine biosynthesis protein TsaE